MAEFIGFLRAKQLDNCEITTPSGSQTLKFQVKSEKLLTIPLFTQQVLKIGRSKTSDIKLDNPTISLKHALIWSVKFDSQTPPIVYVHDCSRNGIFLNEVEMKTGETRMLNDGDQLEFRTAAIFSFESMINEPIMEESQIKPDYKINEQWIVTSNLIGSGSFGSVFIAKNEKLDKKLYAVKILSAKGSGQIWNASYYEASLLANIDHPNIIQIHDAIATNSYVYIVQDLVCGGDLFSYITKGNKLKAIPEREVIFIIFQIMKALQFLHKNLNIVHRDLKLDNILLQIPQPRTKIYLCDFGTAKDLSRSGGRTNTAVGTIEYSAPEVFKRNHKGKSITPYNFKCDIWSLGVVTHILLSGKSPFYSENAEDILISARKGYLNFNIKQFNGVSHKAQSFIRSLLKVNMDDRLDIDECFEHVWIKNNKMKLETFYREMVDQN
ncbi:uncharacterized protein KGF55_001493 [Candida pseudojiufengensis]|uniref:uncharacterized protein n=1 Tax=Candida pseudojiufengensis TaxID=497109 RepID=UPI002224B659|nr:uncharacterized protein KGF55_001493 [Candida pseudojiufengensis]KAI5965273.1 hypothetical protein KGF55_001493 [Candida pseudojiufengensis]